MKRVWPGIASPRMCPVLAGTFAVKTAADEAIFKRFSVDTCHSMDDSDIEDGRAMKVRELRKAAGLYVAPLALKSGKVR
jgi:hypothetical protein